MQDADYVPAFTAEVESFELAFAKIEELAKEKFDRVEIQAPQFRYFVWEPYSDYGMTRVWARFNFEYKKAKP